MTRRRCRYRARCAAAGLLTALLLAAGVPMAWAYFTDAATMASGPFTAHTVVPPGTATCSAGLLTVTVSWPDPAPGYDYTAVLRRADGSVVSTRAVSGTQPASPTPD